MINLYVDDFGYNQQADRGILRLIKDGKLFGVSVLSTLANSSSLSELSSTLKKSRKVILGLHVNLLEQKRTQNRWLPYIYFIFKLFFGRIEKQKIRSAIKNQLAILLKFGMKVKFFDTHQHTHALSPIAEIVQEIALKEGIAYIRSYRSIKTYSLKAKVTHLILKMLALISFFMAYKKIGMPASWKINQEFDWTVMSWEDETVNISSIKNKKAAFIIHPYLPFDTNRSYLRYIE